MSLWPSFLAHPVRLLRVQLNINESINQILEVAD